MDIETLDFDRIMNSNPLDASIYLVGLRRIGIYNQFKRFRLEASKMKKQPLMAPLVARMLTPIHPLLLSTAISISIVRKYDYESFLNLYIKGLEIPNFESSLLRLDQFHDPDELNKILVLEKKFVDIFMEHGIEILVVVGKLIPSGKTPTMLDVYWGAWMAVNPIYQNDEQQQGWLTAIRYSYDLNNDLHNAREYYEYNLNEANKELNNVLKRPLKNKDEIDLIAKKQVNAALLMERSRRFYRWAPNELNAFTQELELLFSMYKTEADFRNFGKTIDSMLKQTGVAPNNYEQFLLPPHIQKRLQNRDRK